MPVLTAVMPADQRADPLAELPAERPAELLPALAGLLDSLPDAVLVVDTHSKPSAARSLIDQIKRTIGFDLIFVTSAPNDKEARELLTELGMPFRDMKKANETEAVAAN